MGAKLFYRARIGCCSGFVPRRSLSWTPAHHSGHNRWSKIRHDKAKEDAVKSKERTLLSQEVLLASKCECCRGREIDPMRILMVTDGGPDPGLNSRLSIAIANAKRGQLSKSSIESAILKGQGKSASGAALENVTIEAMLPFGVAVMVECQTDQKARVLQDIRLIVNKSGGTVTPTAFLFDKKGKIWFEAKSGIGIDEVIDEAIEAGAEDITMEDDRLLVETPPADVTAVAQRIGKRFHIQIHKTEILYVPKADTVVALNDEQGAALQAVLDRFEDEPSLQNLYINAVPES